MEIVQYLNPGFWVVENPIGRLNELIPVLKPFGPWCSDHCNRKM